MVPAKVVTASLIWIAPILAWVGLYAVARVFSASLRPVLPWLSAVRWLAYVAGIILWFAYPNLNLCVSCLAASAGLSLPQSWIKRRFAPELIERERIAGEGWWPKKTE